MEEGKRRAVETQKEDYSDGRHPLASTEYSQRRGMKNEVQFPFLTTEMRFFCVVHRRIHCFFPSWKSLHSEERGEMGREYSQHI